MKLPVLTALTPFDVYCAADAAVISADTARLTAAKAARIAAELDATFDLFQSELATAKASIARALVPPGPLPDLIDLTLDDPPTTGCQSTQTDYPRTADAATQTEDS